MKNGSINIAGCEYLPVGENKDGKNAEVDIAMAEPEYDHIKKETESGIKVYMEFPKRTEINGEKTVQEVKDILLETLKENIRKTNENE